MGRTWQIDQKVIQYCFVSIFGCFLTQLGDPICPQMDLPKACFKYGVLKLLRGREVKVVGEYTFFREVKLSKKGQFIE